MASLSLAIYSLVLRCVAYSCVPCIVLCLNTRGMNMELPGAQSEAQEARIAFTAKHTLPQSSTNFSFLILSKTFNLFSTKMWLLGSSEHHIKLNQDRNLAVFHCTAGDPLLGSYSLYLYVTLSVRCRKPVMSCCTYYICVILQHLLCLGS